MTCADKVETCWRPGLKLSFEFQFSHYLPLFEPSHAFSAGKGRSERQTFKAAFRRIFSPDAFLTALDRSLAPVSFFGPVYSPSSALRPRSALCKECCPVVTLISFRGRAFRCFQGRFAPFIGQNMQDSCRRRCTAIPARYSNEYSFHMKCPACSSLSYTGNLDNLLHSALSSEALSEVCR